MNYCCALVERLYEKIGANAENHSNGAITIGECWGRYFAIQKSFDEHDESGQCS
jgi:hypothetical protein